MRRRARFRVECPQGCRGSSPRFGTNYLDDTPSSSATSCAEPCAEIEAGSVRRAVLATSPQVGRAKVGVDQRGLDVGVTEQLLERLETTAPHHEPAREVMTGVMEME